MGFRYLWIDALCIIQDSLEDWALESRKIGYIYSHAVLNIAASGSSDSHGGCFNSASCSQNSIIGLRSNKLLQLPSTLKDGTKSVLLFWLNEYDRRERLFAGNYRPGENSNVPVLLQNSAVLNRGWIFQERILSKRVVHFTKDQVLWSAAKAGKPKMAYTWIRTGA